MKIERFERKMLDVIAGIGAEASVSFPDAPDKSRETEIFSSSTRKYVEGNLGGISGFWKNASSEGTSWSRTSDTKRITIPRMFRLACKPHGRIGELGVASGF